MRIRDAVAFVTGANRGLGLVLAQELLAAGARKVYAAARQPERITLDGVERVRLDVTQPDTITAAARACPDVNLLINNAGIALWTGFLAPDAVEAARVEMETNYFGPLLLSRAFAPVLAQNGGGAIVNLLSILSWVAVPMAGTYSASKAAAWALTNGLRTGLREQGTHVLGVHAGPIDTDMARQLTLPKVKPVDVVRQVLRALEAGLWGSSGAGRRVACVLQNPWQLRQGRRTPPQMTCPAALYATPVGADGRRRSSRVLCSGYARGHTKPPRAVICKVSRAIRGQCAGAQESLHKIAPPVQEGEQLCPPAALPVQTVRPRVPPGCRPRRRAGAARRVARQRPGCSGAGGGAGGAARKGRLNFLSAAHAILQLLQDDGIDVLFNAEVVQVEGSSGQGTRIRLRTSEGERTLEGSDLLVAVGRVPNTQGLGLEKAGVEGDGRVCWQPPFHTRRHRRFPDRAR
jgi:NAD(P)-dependent dehydrogenase (short-subunit alcohol dehydrogenase family)